MMLARSARLFTLAAMAVVAAAGCGDSSGTEIGGSGGGDGSGGAGDVGDVGTGDAGSVDAGPDADARDEVDVDAATDADDGSGGLAWATPDEMLDAVNVFIGSGGLGFGYASLTPAVQWPNGFVKLGPDTTNRGAHPEQQHFSGYLDSDPDIRGFSHVRLVGTGAADLGLLRVMPLETLDGVDPDRLWLRRDRSAEVGRPGWYEVSLGEPATHVELTATEWVGVHRYTFDAGDGAVLFDVTASIVGEGIEDSSVTVDGRRIEGWVRHRGGFAGRARAYTVFFAAELSRDPENVWVFNGEFAPLGESTTMGQRTGAVAEFGAGDPVELRVGLSLIDADQAEQNLRSVDGQSIEEVAAQNRSAWGRVMERVRVRGATDDVRTIFFTALYNAHRMPTRLDEPSGEYRGVDGEVHQVDEGYRYYTDLSLWDTFRTLHPWYLFAHPDLQRDCLWSLMRMYDQGGHIPQWPAMLGDTGSMLGASANMLFAESMAAGLGQIDYTTAFEALFESDYGVITDPAARGRDNVQQYAALGYMPSSHGESVSHTLEYAWADDALWRMATTLGDDRAGWLDERARSFENTFDPAQGFFAPRSAEGVFETIENPDSVNMGDGHYTEGSAWHWRFYALQRPERLAELLGGTDAMGDLLEEYFAESSLGRSAPINNFFPGGYYWHGNEVALHSSALFDIAGRPDRRWYWMRQIQSRLYGVGADGLAGNDDGGALSTWYVWTALGLYPIAGTGRYLLGAPLFDAAEVTTMYGVFHLSAPGITATPDPPRSATLNGAPVDAAGLTFVDVADGTLEFAAP